MNSSDPSQTKKPLEYNRVIINVPTGLLKDFDDICSLKHYSRVEALKEAMRRFVEENQPEDFLTYEESRKQYETMWKGMYDALLGIINDPKYKQLQEQNLIQPQNFEKTKQIQNLKKQ